MASRNDLLSPEYIGEVRQHFIFCKGKCVGVGGEFAHAGFGEFRKGIQDSFQSQITFLLYAHPNFEFFLQPCKEIEG